MKVEELKIGNIYFMCTWVVTEVQIPKITSIAYYGIHKDPDYNNEHIFVDPEWYYSDKNKSNSYETKESNYFSISSYEIETLVSNLNELGNFVKKLGKEKDAQRIF